MSGCVFETPPNGPLGFWADPENRLTLAPYPLLCADAAVVDDRGVAVYNRMRCVLSSNGQLNHANLHAGVIKAWHRHTRQIDYWMCLSGTLQAQVYLPGERPRAWRVFMTVEQPTVLVIPPGLWHGLRAVTPVTMLYYTSTAYDPADEARAPYDAFDLPPWEQGPR